MLELNSVLKEVSSSSFDPHKSPWVAGQGWGEGLLRCTMEPWGGGKSFPVHLEKPLSDARCFLFSKISQLTGVAQKTKFLGIPWLSGG